MEQSNNRLYSGPLSQAAQKILAVLRAQSKASNNAGQSQSGKNFDSQREPSVQSSRSMTHDEGKYRDLDCNEGMRQSFIIDLAPDDVNTEEHKNSQKQEPNLGCHSASSSFNVSDDAGNDALSPLKKNDAKDNRLKINLPPADLSEEAESGEDRVLLQHLESETIKTQWTPLPLTGSDISCLANSLNLKRLGDVEENMELRVDRNVVAIGQILHSEHELNIQSDRVGFKQTGQITLPHEIVSPNEMEDCLLFGSHESIPAFTSSCYSEAVEHRPGLNSKAISGRCFTSYPKRFSLSLESGRDKFLTQTVNETTEKHLTKWAMVQWEGNTTADHLDRPAGQRVDVLKADSTVEIKGENKGDNHTGTGGETEHSRFSDIQLSCGQFEACYEEVKGVPRGDSEPGERGIDRDEPVMVLVNREEEGTSTEGSRRERCPTSTSFQGFWVGDLKVPYQNHDNMQSMGKSCKGTSTNIAPSPAGTFTSRQITPMVPDSASFAVKPSKKLENQVSTFQPHLYPHSLKRKHEALKQQDNPLKICLNRHRSKWEPPCSSQAMIRERIRSVVSPEHLAKSINLDGEGMMSGVHTHQCVPKQMQQKSPKREEECHDFTSASKQTQASMTYESKISRGWDSDGVPQSKAGCWTKTLTSNPRVKNSGKLNTDEKVEMLQKAAQAKVLVLTMVYQDGSTQLDPEQKFTPAVCGLLMLMILNDLDRSAPEHSLGHINSLLFLNLSEEKPWAQQNSYQSQELFTRDMLLLVLSRPKLVVCYKAKDFLRTALQFYRGDLTLKHVAGCHVQDPQVSAWLLDPSDPFSCYQDLLNKHCKRPTTVPALGIKKLSQVISGLYSLYWINLDLCSKLQSQGLWEIYSDMELNMIPVLAAMESHCIYVDKDALKRTSDLLGSKMKQLEQEAHQAAGQIFLITSNTQLRTVLFEKLRLHDRCENKKLPKTINKQQSTSEAALLQLQDLHPLPKIILEHRQIHKIKSTFVDGILSCMKSKDYISCTWNQTSVVTGRISAKHPNFQALPRQPLQINNKQLNQGKKEEVVSVHPRAMFVPQKGWTFLAADFCQVELRLLAHLSSDPELLRIFTNPQADVFTMLASQWKGMSEGEVTSEDREHAKRIVYSVVYGAGRERLSGILGVSADQASQFQDSFLQTYKEVHTFIQKTIHLCHKQGYVLSIMGRRRILPNINSPVWGVRMQAERQAVNFIVQASAADLCKMAMIRIFNLITSSSSLTARLIAQLHDELLYEVEDSQVKHFAALVKRTMESLQHIDYLGVHLKVPLKVAISSGKSWGSMSELDIPTASPSHPL